MTTSSGSLEEPGDTLQRFRDLEAEGSDTEGARLRRVLR